MARTQNALFNSKTVSKLIESISISEEQKIAANEWLELLEKDKLKDEKSNYLFFWDIILIRLLNFPKLTTQYEKENVEFQFPDETGKNIVCFEVKGTSTEDLFSSQHRTKKEHATPIKQTWDYMGKNNLDYGICTNYRSFVLIKKTEGYSKYHYFDFKNIRDNDEKLKEFVAIFSKSSIIETPTIKNLYEDSIIAEQDFTEEFYKLFHETRLMLKKEFEECGFSNQEAIKYTQLFLNRLIFTFFVEDNGNIPNRLFSDRIFGILNTDQITEHSQFVFQIIKDIFTSLDEGSKVYGVFAFNGGLFKEKIPAELSIRDLRDEDYFSEQLQNSKLKKQKLSLNKNLKKIYSKYEGKLNPIIENLLRMDSFDFTSDLNVNILGHIFEQSLSDIEELKQNIVSRRKKEGIYYTPDYITDYICRNTIIPYLSKSNSNNIGDLIYEYLDNIEELEEKIRGIKILDPACGSGAFLIKAVDILLELDKEIQKIKNPKSFERQSQIYEYSEEKEITKIIENNIYGVDINDESVEITRLSLFLKLASSNKKLIDLSKQIKVGNSLIDDSRIDKEKSFVWESEFLEIVGKTGFNVIIGNPPYGAKISKKEQEYLNEKFQIGNSDSAQLMIKRALGLLSKDGYHGFIVPKSLTYASNWKKIQELILDDLSVLIDVGKVWKEVKLEQSIYITNSRTKNNFYLTGVRDGHVIDITANIPKDLCSVFGFLLNGITKEELVLGRKILDSSEKLGKYSSNVRGAMIQSKVSNKGDTKIIGGQQVQRFFINGEKGKITRSEIKDKKAVLDKDSCLVQNIVAHIANPIDHIKITSTVPLERNFTILDTVNQVICKEISSFFVSSLLNSKIINWYAYRFIFAKAIRTMHFDKPVTDRIPLLMKNEKNIEKITKELIEKTEEFNKIQKQFVENVKRTYNVEKISNEIKNYFEISFNDFIKAMKKLSSVKLLPDDEDDYSNYFEKKKNESLKLQNNILKLIKKINEEFYNVFNLNKNEISLIEVSTPE